MRAGATYRAAIASHRRNVPPVAWLAVAALSAVALIVAVVSDLRRTVDEQDARARSQALRDAERAAAELRGALLAPATLARVPAWAQYSLDADGQVVVPEAVGALSPEPTFDVDHELDALARERLRRAACAPDVAAALTELAPLFADAAIPPRARAWLHAHAAWLAHRGGAPAARDEHLAQVGTACPDAIASAAWLSETLVPGTFVSLSTIERLARGLPFDRIRAVHELLTANGASEAANALLAAARDVQRHRATLRVAATFARELSAATTPTIVKSETKVPGTFVSLLHDPERRAGAVLDAAMLIAALGDTNAATLSVGPLPTDAIPIADTPLHVLPATPPAPGPFAGATGTAALVTALALLCGAGSLLAFRALRRETDALRTRAEFLTTVTHELKTPVAGVRLVAELLADGHVTDAAERTRWLARLNAEAVRLGTLVENVLDLGRLERGERPHAPARHDVGALVAETAALFAPLAERDGIPLTTTTPTAAPAHADVDPSTFRQALLNILDNARKYGRPPLTLTVTHTPQTRRVEVTVRDHGPGIPAAERDAVFERFRRGTAHRDGHVPGVGLGLHLARAIAHRHGGTLTCDAPADGGPGASFTLTLETCA